MSEKLRVYLASAIFNTADRDYAKKILNKLESNGLSVYWPWRDAGDAYLKSKFKGEMLKVNDEIVKRNLKAIRRSDIVIAISEGADVDSGTSMEIGYSNALGKPIFGLRTDFRTHGEHIGNTNIMLTRSMAKLFSNENDLINTLKTLKRDIKKDEIPEFYSVISEEYTDLQSHPITNAIRIAENVYTKCLLKGKKYNTALDLGCGRGEFLENVSAKIKIGADISESMIELYKKSNPRYNFIISNIEHGIPIRSGSVDIVHSSFLLDHINDVKVFFSEVNRVLRNNDAILLLSFHDKLMEKYRKNSESFIFKSVSGGNYNVPSTLRNISTITELSSNYFKALSKDTISIKTRNGRIGLDYLVLGVKK